MTDSEFARLQGSILPSVEPRDRIEALGKLDPEQLPVWQPMTGDLGLVYVAADGATKRTLRYADLEKWHIAAPLVMIVAEENICAYNELSEARIIGEQGGPALLFHHADAPIAAAIAIASFQRCLQTMIGGPALVTMPRRNALLAIGAGNRDGIETFVEQTEKLHRTARHPLSRALIRLDGGNLQPA